MRMICKLACVAILLAAGGATFQARPLDGVVGSSGISIFGTIIEVTRDKVTLRTQTGNKVFPANEIQKLTFAEDPPELRSARQALGNGQIEAARSYLRKISTARIQRPEVLQDIAFYRAYCDAQLALSGGGDKAAAVKELRDFQEKPANHDSYHYYATVQLLGDLAVALGRNDVATKYYSMLEQAPWPDYKMRAGVLVAHALLANQQIKEALDKYNEILGMALDDAASREQKLLAQVGKAQCMAELGQPDAGITTLKKIIAENDSHKKSLLFARAYNALGACYVKAKKPKDALLAYLHVDLLFFQNPDAHAEALYHLTQLWRAVNRAERALQARSLLESRYGGTVWASRK